MVCRKRLWKIFRSLPEPESEVPQFETFAVVEDEEEIGQVAPVAADEFETNAAPGSTFSDPTASFADLNEDSRDGFSTSASDFQEVDFSIVTPADTEPAASGDSGSRGRSAA